MYYCEEEREVEVPTKKEMIGRTIAVITFWTVIPFLLFFFVFKQDLSTSIFKAFGVLLLAVFINGILPLGVMLLIGLFFKGK